MFVHPALGPSLCGFGSNKGCGVMAPQIKMVYGKKKGAKVVESGEVAGNNQVSAGNTSGERPFHYIAC